MLEMKQEESRLNILPHNVPINIPVKMLTSPTERFMARRLDDAWVDELATPSNGATLTGRVYSCVVFKEDLPEELLDQINAEVNSATFELDECKANIENCIKAFRAQLVDENAVFHVYAGNHGSHAVKQLSTRYPRNPLFTQVQCTLMILDKTEENFDMLFSLGTFDNAAQMNSRKTPFNEAAQRLRTQWKAIETLVEGLPVSEQPKQLRTRSGICMLMKKLAAAMMIPRNEMGLIMAVAKVSDAVWVPLSKILNRETPLGVGGVPKSSAAFTKMAKIPDHKLIEWLDDVVIGTLQMKEFKTKCATWKNARKLWEEVVGICTDDLIAPEGTDDEKAWRSGLSSDDARDLLRDQFPTLVDMIKDRAHEFRNASIRELCAGNFLSRCTALVQSERAAKLNTSLSQVWNLISF